MKWWKALLIFLLFPAPASAGFWSDFPGVGPGTVLNNVIIDNSTINSSTLNQPIINDPTFNGISTYNPGTVINYDPSTIINGPNGSVWNSYGITNLKNLTIATGGTIVVPPTGTIIGPDGGTWTNIGITLPITSTITVGKINITGIPPSLTFNGVPIGGTCTGMDFVNAISETGVPSCATPAGAGGGPPLPLSVANGGLGQGTAPVTGQILVATSATQYSHVTMSGDATINSAGVITVNSFGGGKLIQPLTSTAITAPTNPVIGQFWFDPIDLQTYVWYNDGTSTQWAPVVNLGTAFNNSTFTGTTTFNGGAVFNSSVTFTGPITMPAGSITDVMLASGYSGIGACTAGQFVNALNRNAPPTCSAPSLTGLTLNNPTFTGTLQFPDGSYYDTNGHEVMKNLGVGVVARTAGVGGTYGSSMTVWGSGWGQVGTAAQDAFWDRYGIEQMWTVNANSIMAPTVSGDAYFLAQGDVLNNALNNPFPEYAFQNQSSPRPAEDPTWQSEGLEAMNGLGIHTNTWDQLYGCNINASPGYWLGGCAILAIPDPAFADINYRIVLANLHTTANAQATYELQTYGTYLTELTAYGSGYSLIPSKASSAELLTTEPNGLMVGTAAGTGPVNIEVGGNTIGKFKLPVLPNGDTLDIMGNLNSGLSVFLQNTNTGGTGTQAQYGANAGDVGNNLWLAQTGGQQTGLSGMAAGSGFIYDDSALALIGGWRNPEIELSLNLDGVHNTTEGQILHDTFTHGLRLKGYGRYDGDSYTSFNLGQGYLTSNGWANLTLTGAVYYNSATGQWISDGGAGGGASLLQIGWPGISGIAGGLLYTGGVGGGAIINWTPIMTWDQYGLYATHIHNNQNYGVPTVNGGTLVGGSRDSFGEIIASAGYGSVNVVFSHPFYGSSECTLTDDGAGYFWFVSNRSASQVNFNCVVPSTGAACTGQWVIYHCFGMGG